jgi:hypothetical protein
MANPTITVEVDAPSTIDGTYLTIGSGSVIGTSLVAGSPIWADRTSYVREFSIGSGSASQQMVWTADAGTATVMFDNLTRIFDPVSNSDIKTARAIRIRATWNGVTYDLFRGTVDAWQPSYPGNARDAITTAECSDGISQLANAEFRDTAPEQTSGARIRRLANLIDWSPSLRDIDDGLSSMNRQAQTASAWSAMQDAAISEMGELYVSPNGTLTFRDRDALWTEARSTTSQATFGDSTGELKFADLEPIGADVNAIRNQVSIVYNESGSTVTLTDGGSAGSNGVRSEQLQVSLTERSTAKAFAQFLLTQFADPQVTFGSITIVPRADPTNLWPQVLGRKLGDRITIKLTPPGGGARITREAFIRSIEHSVSPGLQWSTTFGLQDATLWPDVFVVGTHNVGDTTYKIGW